MYSINFTYRIAGRNSFNSYLLSQNLKYIGLTLMLRQAQHTLALGSNNFIIDP